MAGSCRGLCLSSDLKSLSVITEVQSSSDSEAEITYFQASKLILKCFLEVKVLLKLHSGSFIAFPLFAEKITSSSLSEIHPSLAFESMVLTCSFTDETDNGDLRLSFKILLLE